MGVGTGGGGAGAVAVFSFERANLVRGPMPKVPPKLKTPRMVWPTIFRGGGKIHLEKNVRRGSPASSWRALVRPMGP